MFNLGVYFLKVFWCCACVCNCALLYGGLEPSLGSRLLPAEPLSSSNSEELISLAFYNLYYDLIFDHFNPFSNLMPIGSPSLWPLAAPNTILSLHLWALGIAYK